MAASAVAGKKQTTGDRRDIPPLVGSVPQGRSHRVGIMGNTKGLESGAVDIME